MSPTLLGVEVCGGGQGACTILAGENGRHLRTGTITIVGDVRLDIRTALTDARFSDIAHDHDIFGPVRLTVAGTAANLAQHAVTHFEHVNVIASVGTDFATPGIREHLATLGARSRLYEKPEFGNGAIAVVHDRESSRIMVSGEPSPNLQLSEDDVNDATDVLASSDIVCTDGYFLRGRASRSAVNRLLDICNELKVPVCFDIVPHDLPRYVAMDELLPVLARSSVVISNAPTVAMLLGLRHSDQQDEALARSVAERLAERVGSKITWLIRWGPRNIDHVVDYRGHVHQTYSTGFGSAPDKAAFGDRIAAAELWCWLNGVDVDPDMWRP